MSVTNDYISRQAAIDEIKAVYEWHDVPTEDRLIQHFKDLPSAQPEQKDFEKQIHDMFDHIWDCEIDHPVFQDTVGDLMIAVIQAHNNSAQPERANGKWINDGDPATWVCSNCGYRVMRYNNTKFCPNCGAEMNNCSNEENKWVSEIHNRLMDETGGKAVYKNEHWGRGDNNVHDQR